MASIITYILSSAFNIILPFGFSFGIMIVTVWTLPMLIRFIKSIF